MRQSAETEALFTFENPEDFRRLRDLLQGIGYTDKGILEALGVSDLPIIRGSDIQILLRRTHRGTPLDALIRLFLNEIPVDAESLQKAIQPMKLDTWTQAGLVEMKNSSVVAAVKLLPYSNLVLAYDLPKRLQQGQYDYVMGIGSSSITLSNLTIRSHAGATLDLGTGCGIQALLAASHSDQVLAVDKNPRAVRIVSFNAKLNGMENVEPLEGDLLEPVEGRTFDLVVSNPPFVISPERSYIYRDSGLEGDEICRKIVREVPRFLREGGYCQILCNWAEKTGEDWQKRLETWFEGTGCDVWIMRSESRNVATYAYSWIRHTEMQEPLNITDRFETWMNYYEHLGIESVSAGVITMRRRDGVSNWFRADESPDKMLGPSGDVILQGFGLRDFLETVQNDSRLLDARLHLSPEIRLKREYEPSAGGWKEVAAEVHLKKGLAYSGNADRYVTDLLITCDGQRRVGELLNGLADSSGVDRQKITAPFCEVVRRLIERGFLLPE
jgi:SAM-dependent methyltransferase